jgi:hypothetical protein
MFTPSRQSTRIVLALNVIAAALICLSLPARAGEGGAIAAGVAGEVLSGAPPPQNYYAPGNPPQPQCHYEHRQEFSPYSFHIGWVQVCD